MALLQTLLGNTSNILNPAASAKQGLAQGQATAQSVTQPLGVKATAPTPTPPVTTLPKSQTAPLIKSGTINNSTQNASASTPTQSTPAQPAYGQAVYSPQTGAYQGNAAFNVQTGAPLQNPNVQPDTSTQAQNVAASNNPNPTFAGAVAGLAGSNLANQALGQNAQNIGTQSGQDLNNLRQQAATLEGDFGSQGTLPGALGAQQIIAQTEAAKEQGIIGGATQALAGNAQALTGQAQTQAAEQAAGTLSAPQVTTPGQAVFNPATGTYTNASSGGSNPTAAPSGIDQNSWNQYIQDYANGAFSAIPANITGNTNLSGQLQAAVNAQNPNFNYNAAQGAASAAQSNAQTLGTLNTNISAANQTALGTAATAANAKSVGDFTNQINTTQKSVTTLNNLADQLVPGMSSVGFNPTSSVIGNQTFSQYFTEKNPAAKAGIEAGLGEIKNQVSNVIAAATGLTPTGVTSVTDSYDFTDLNPAQLSSFLQYINQYAQSNINGAQNAISTINSGGVAPASVGVLPAPSANSTGQAAGATGANLAEGLISKIVSAASGAVAGAAGGAVAEGLASKVLQ